METQKIENLLNGSDNENSKFKTKKWYVIDNESKGNYSHENPIKVLTKSIESSLSDYSDAYILVTGDIAVKKRNDDNTNYIDITQATQVVRIKIFCYNIWERLMINCLENSVPVKILAVL